jgi:FkbM family methyltransferase
MGQVSNLELTLAGRTVRFAMEIDPNFIQDRNLLACLHADHCCEPEVAAVMARVLCEGDVAVDCGAAVGFFTLFMASLVGETGKVLAVEPAANNLPKLRENIRLSGFNERVEVFEDPLWSIEMQRPFFTCQDSGLCSLMRPAQYKAETMRPTTTLDRVVRGRKPRLIKMDCEGAEFEIIRQSRVLGDLNTYVPYVIMELNEQALLSASTNVAEVQRKMRAYGYEMFALHRDGVLPTYLAPQANLKFTRQNVNVLFSNVYEVLKAWPEIHL